MTGSRHGCIRVVSLAVLPSADGSIHAVAVAPPSRENPDGYHRLVGGGVEWGETAREAVVREVREELGADLHDVVLLGVLENLFELDGMPGHEVVFVHTGRLAPADAVPPEGGIFDENGEPMPVGWRPIEDGDVPVPLYPNGVGELIRANLIRPEG